MQTPCRDTLLIVDDSELNRAILREIFYREYRIEEAENCLLYTSYIFFIL